MTAGMAAGIAVLCANPKRHRIADLYQTNNGLLLAWDRHVSLLVDGARLPVRCSRCRRSCVVEMTALRRETRSGQREYVAPFA